MNIFPIAAVMVHTDLGLPVHVIIPVCLVAWLILWSIVWAVANKAKERACKQQKRGRQAG